MLRAFVFKLKESLVSVLPVTAIVILLNFTPLVNFSVRETGEISGKDGYDRGTLRG